MKKLKGFSIGVVGLLIFFLGCTNSDLPNIKCADSDLSITVTGTDPADCASKGSIAISASGGKEPYLFSLDAGAFVSDGSFDELIAGSHIARVKDKNGCIVVETVELANPG